MIQYLPHFVIQSLTNPTFLLPSNETLFHFLIHSSNHKTACFPSHTYTSGLTTSMLSLSIHAPPSSSNHSSIPPSPINLSLTHLLTLKSETDLHPSCSSMT